MYLSAYLKDFLYLRLSKRFVTYALLFSLFSSFFSSYTYRINKELAVSHEIGHCRYSWIILTVKKLAIMLSNRIRVGSSSLRVNSC